MYIAHQPTKRAAVLLAVFLVIGPISALLLAWYWQRKDKSAGAT